MATSTSRVPLWLDCDPGHDDAFAILLAAYHPGLELLGISSVFGNASVSHTTANAAAVLTAIGKETSIPLYRGSEKALERPAAHAPEVHGESGLEGTYLLPKPACEARKECPVDSMYNALMAQPKDTAWLVATGALTNVALLLGKFPDIAEHLKGISIMGGSFGDGFTDAPPNVVDGKVRVGNIGAWAEFNILIDPEAAAVLFHNKDVAAKITLIPLDLSHLVLATKQVREMLLYGPEAAASEKDGKGKSSLRKMLVELLDFFSGTYANVFGVTEGPPLHDAIAVAALLIGTANEISFREWREKTHPEHKERFEVTIVTEGTFDEAKNGDSQCGRTIAKVLPAGSEGVRIPRGVDVTKFWSEIEACISRADAVNSKNGKTFWEEYRPSNGSVKM